LTAPPGHTRCDTRKAGPSAPADARATPAVFTVDGPHAASDAARIDTGAKLAISQNAWMFASFDAKFSSRSQSYAGKTRAKMSW
jgi:uncharacterized protein with beta-barrel porin domain